MGKASVLLALAFISKEGCRGANESFDAVVYGAAAIAGQSAGAAAALAIKMNPQIHHLDLPALQQDLRNRKQALTTEDIRHPYAL